MVIGVMEQDIKYSRPNTVAGLVSKHKELMDLRDRYREEIKKLTVDIDHLDASIRLFDPNADTYAIKQYVTKHKAQKGSVKRFILNTLRTSDEPLTSRDLTERWAADRGLAADEATYSILRKRIGACIKTCVNQGLVEFAGMGPMGPTGQLKLWRVKT